MKMVPRLIRETCHKVEYFDRVEMPTGSKVLDAKIRDHVVWLIWMVDPEKIDTSSYLVCIVPSERRFESNGLRYVSTVRPDESRLFFHVFVGDGG